MPGSPASTGTALSNPLESPWCIAAGTQHSPKSTTSRTLQSVQQSYMSSLTVPNGQSKGLHTIRNSAGFFPCCSAIAEK